MGVWMKNDAIHEDVRALKQQVKNVCAHAVSACMHRAKPYAVSFLFSLENVEVYHAKYSMFTF